LIFSYLVDIPVIFSLHAFMISLGIADGCLEIQARASFCAEAKRNEFKAQTLLAERIQQINRLEAICLSILVCVVERLRVSKSSF
jgi:hypothetical protein